MNQVNSDEAWRFIPPEEKIEILSRAHAKGIIAAIICTVIGATFAISLQIPWLLWTTLLCSPFVFQFSSGKAWRDLRPALILKYLAARSVARRYAFSAQSEDLSPKLIFRGSLEVLEDSEKGVDEEDSTILLKSGLNQARDVWITLFDDTLVILSEDVGGAVLELAHPIEPHMTLMRAEGSESHKVPDALILSINERVSKKTFKLESPYPAALTAFEQIYHVCFEKNKNDYTSI